MTKVRDEIMVQFKDGVTEIEIKALVAGLRLGIIDRSGVQSHSVYLLKVPKGLEDQWVKALQDMFVVHTVERNIQYATGWGSNVQ